MDLWRIIVFAIVKQCLNLDYDALLYRANNGLLLREMLGHGDAGFDEQKYRLQRLKDHVQLLTQELILQVSPLIVRTGHEVAGNSLGARYAAGAIPGWLRRMCTIPPISAWAGTPFEV